MSSCKAGFKSKIVRHHDGTKSTLCKRVSGRPKPLTAKQKAYYQSRRGKKLSAITKQRMSK